MTKLEELERTIDNLPEEEYRLFRHWFMEKTGKDGTDRLPKIQDRTSSTF